MDSGCTCHMTPHKSEFLPNTFVHEHKMIEVADGSSTLVEFSGTVHLHIFTETHEKLILTLQNVLYVPTLSRCLFYLTSLIEQGYDVKLSRKKGVQIFFDQTQSPVTLKMTNYHPFASAAMPKPSSTSAISAKNKQKIDLDILYRRLGFRSIKSLLSANQADLWHDSMIVVRTYFISSSNHDIATIRNRNQHKHTESDTSLKPGQILCLDIVQNPTKCTGLTQDTNFKYYLLAVDKFSLFPFLVGLLDVKADTIIIALQYIRTQLLPSNLKCDIIPISRLQSD